MEKTLNEVMEEVTREYLTFNMDLEKNHKESGSFDLPESMRHAIPMSEIW